MKVSVKSDDPAYFDGYVTECLLRVHQETPDGNVLTLIGNFRDEY